MVCNLGIKKWRAGEWIREILLSDTAVTFYIGDKVFPIVAIEPKQQKDLGDFIVYSREKYSREVTKVGIVDDECVVVLRIVTEDYDRGLDIVELVDELVIGVHSITDVGRIEISLKDSNEYLQDLKYVQEIQLEIK